ncbi:MAG TPA: ROK family transcriptional regulator [Pseudonocardiaceae bacterium]|jgi:predicted NBD/HSP70 family sugar kinase|nr:ROK family transcriptional regulator [Pseudonocardiaceae bacterium]
MSSATPGSRASGAATVLRAVLDRGPVARSTIARSTGLSPAAVTRHTADLAASGLIRQLPQQAAAGGFGRPHLPVDIDLDQHVVAGVHIAVGHSTLAILDLRGNVLAQESLPHEESSPQAVLSAAARRLPAFVGRHSGERMLLGVGVASGGWVDPGRGVVVEHAPLAWREVGVREIFARHTRAPVVVDNHARALATAEQLFGQARSAASVVHLFVGNVVDAAIVTGGSVHHGPGSTSGDIAHQPLGDPALRCPCGRRGCLQATVSSSALAHRAAAEGIIARPSFPALLAAAKAGDPRARKVFLRRAEVLGGAVALLLAVVNPDVLVITEEGMLFLPEGLDTLRATVAARSHAGTDPVRQVVVSSFPAADLLAVAAGTVALEAVYRDPTGLGCAVATMPSVAAAESR